MTMEVAVVVATRRRPERLTNLLHFLSAQTYQPALIVVSAVDHADLGASEVESLHPVVHVVLNDQEGLARQRNRGIDVALEQHPGVELFIFFDDDFRPCPHWIERCVEHLDQNPDFPGATGLVLRDGVRLRRAITESEASEIVAAGTQSPTSPARSTRTLYGCNMAIRRGALDLARFCEDLPQYGWLEDLDMSGQLRAMGQLSKVLACRGVHLGAPESRAGAGRLGYWQISNPIHLRRRGTISRRRLTFLLSRAIVANLLYSSFGARRRMYRRRRAGNIVAVRDFLRSHLHPSRALIHLGLE